MPRSKRSGKRKTTPATVKRATAKILSDEQMLTRVRRVEARNRSTSSYNDMKDVVSRKPVPLPAAVSLMTTTRRGAIGDLVGLSYSCVCGEVVSGSGAGTNVNQLYFNPGGSAIGSVTFAVPLALADAIYGITAFADVLKHFQRIRFRKTSLVIEPIGAGASTAAGVTVVIAPALGGTMAPGSFQATAATTALSVQAVRSSKGAVEFPAYKTVRIPMQEYIGGDDRKGTFGIPSINSVATGNTTQYVANALSVPTYFLVAGTSPSGTAANSVWAIASWEGEIDLLDFQATSWSNPVGKPNPSSGDVKEPAPRSVLADRGQIPSPPDDRAWVNIPSLGRLGHPKWEDVALGRASAVGDVKPTAEVPNSGRTAR